MPEFKVTFSREYTIFADSREDAEDEAWNMLDDDVEEAITDESTVANHFVMDAVDTEEKKRCFIVYSSDGDSKWIVFARDEEEAIDLVFPEHGEMGIGVSKEHIHVEEHGPIGL